MDQDTEKLVEERIAELPEDIQAAILSTDLSSKLRTIATEEHLHIDQAGSLEDETLLVMLGFADLEEFPARLSGTLRVTPEIGSKVAERVNNEIFANIRESMKKFTAQHLADANPVEAPTRPPAENTPPVGAVKEDKLFLPEVDHLLTEKTISVPPAAALGSDTVPPAPPLYEEDPYREPIK